MNATQTRPEIKTAQPIRTGYVRILRAEMARILGMWAKSASVKALAATGNLLLEITSETKRGPLVATYRVEAIQNGVKLMKGLTNANGEWIADTDQVYTLDQSFDLTNPRCDCEDARKRCPQCKHVRAARACGLVS